MSRIGSALMSAALAAAMGCLGAQGAGDLSALGDEFNDPRSLAGWKVMSEEEGLPDRIERMDIGESNPGCLTIVPLIGGWWQGYQGAFLYKEVTGDFFVSLGIRVTGKNTALPTSKWNRGGLLVRRPVDPEANRKKVVENFFHITSGVDDKGCADVYTGNSVNNSYTWALAPATAIKESRDMELGIARIGNCFVALSKAPGEGWKIRNRKLRPDMPATIQVGIQASADPYDASGNWSNPKYSYEAFSASVVPSSLPPDIVCIVDWYRLRRPDIAAARAAELEGLFLNRSILTDDALMAELTPALGL